MIYVIDDDNQLLHAIKNLLKSFKLKCRCFNNEEEVISAIKCEPPSIVLCDIYLPNKDGFHLLQEIKSIDSNIRIIMMTAYSSVESAVEAIKMGAFDYIEKPVDIKKFELVINKALAQYQLIVDNQKLKAQLDSQHKFDDIVGRCKPMKNVFTIIEKAAPSDISIMIYGESGTGKELIARSIHKYSNRNKQPFVPVDCVAIPNQLIESELFGYEKGAFTGATKSQQGLIESAHKGTIFLDEITELNIDLQAKLLRMLQERQLRKVGGRTLTDVDIRVISATNRDPKQAIIDGKLREDLFYRLNVIPLELPPLRERSSDISLLLQYFIKCMNDESSQLPKRFTPNALDMLQNYSWPGNIRELKNLVECLVTLVNSDLIDVDDLPSVIKNESFNLSDKKFLAELLPFKEAKDSYVEYFESRYLEKVLAKFNGNISKAAEYSKINRRTIHRLINKHNI